MHLGRVTALLAVPALVATAFLVLHTSVFAIRSVDVAGALETSSAEIIAVAGLDRHPPLIDVNPAAVSARIAALPWIKTAVVTRHWPRSVTITVTERVPIAEASTRPRRWELFDATGRALGYRKLKAAALVRVRQVLPMPTPGSVASGALAGEIALAGALPVALMSQVQEVTDSAGGELGVTLLSGVTVKFGGDSALSDKVVALTTLLADHVSLTGVTSIDLTVPSSPILDPTPPATKAPVRTTKPVAATTNPTTTIG